MQPLQLQISPHTYSSKADQNSKGCFFFLKLQKSFNCEPLWDVKQLTHTENSVAQSRHSKSKVWEKAKTKARQKYGRANTDPCCSLSIIWELTWHYLGSNMLEEFHPSNCANSSICSSIFNWHRSVSSVSLSRSPSFLVLTRSCDLHCKLDFIFTISCRANLQVSCRQSGPATHCPVRQAFWGLVVCIF